MLVRLTYASRICPGYGHLQIEGIVSRARSFNGEHGITGVLAFDGLQIMQLLEGPDSEVDALFDRIAADDRHEDIVRLFRDPIAGLHFQEWGMARLPFIDTLKILKAIGH